ncbi:hypothetical protein CDEST_08755 [Colletotrichum destructivum]|uniref:Secreted protein n=1 Tax=Colletotrichum destructivum TaxID=34406 RepID=A0AAX4ILE6_9PEZI|nr:hypothetical protein CDEST_08755 [Colletotrichum destructivum]
MWSWCVWTLATGAKSSRPGAKLRRRHRGLSGLRGVAFSTFRSAVGLFYLFHFLRRLTAWAAHCRQLASSAHAAARQVAWEEAPFRCQSA